MRRNAWSKVFAALVALLLLARPSEAATSYIATPLGPGFIQYTSYGVGNAFGSTLVGFANVQPTPTVSEQHAFMWTGSGQGLVDLHPAGYTHSAAMDASANYQIGVGSSPANSNLDHALRWSGTAASVVDLNPASASASAAYGISGSNIAGAAFFTSDSTWHAVILNADSPSVIDLKPVGYGTTRAYDIDGDSQVGIGYPGLPLNPWHAMLWHGTAASAVDLNPVGFQTSTAWAVHGDLQGGSAFTAPGVPLVRHAMLWSGSAASAIDLKPPGNYTDSEVLGMSAAGQVGYAKILNNTQDHAFLWNGSAASAIDLHPFLAASGLSGLGSRATTIRDDGVIFGWSIGPTRAVMWTPVTVPEPASCALSLGAIVAAMLLRAPRPLS